MGFFSSLMGTKKEALDEPFVKSCLNTPDLALRNLVEEAYDEVWKNAKAKGLSDETCCHGTNIRTISFFYEAEAAFSIPSDKIAEIAKWESSPFNILPHKIGKIALTEYIVWRQYPDKADMKVVTATMDNFVSYLKKNKSDELLDGFLNAPFFAWIPWKKLLKNTGVQVVEEDANSFIADVVTSKSNVHHNTFSYTNEEIFTPLEYGIKAIKIALDGSVIAVNQIVGSNESRIQNEILTNRGPVQLHFMALQAAAHYVCANTLTSNRDVLTDVSRGIADGFAAVMGEYHSDNLYEIFKDYAHSLAKELALNDFENFMDMGETANLVVNNISGQCHLDKTLADNPIEKLLIGDIARNNGIRLLLTLLTDKGITYNE